MSEPVGNAQRSAPSGPAAIPGNTHKAREAQEDVAQAREKVEKVVEGKVVTRRPAWWKRASRSIIAEDAASIGDFVREEVFLPAIRNLIREIIVGGTDKALYGSMRNSAKGPVSRVLGGRESIATRYDRMSEGGSARSLSREARARHDFAEIVLSSRSEAVEVVESLISLVNRFGTASVADLYDLVGTTGSYADRNWGWMDNDLSSADVRQVRSGFLLDLPRPRPLR